MTTTPGTTTYAPTGDPIEGNYNNNFIEPSANQPGQVQGSSYAAMAGAVFMIASLMTLLNISYNQVAEQETAFQAKYNNAQRQATLDEGHAQAMQQWMQMGSSLAGAAASLGGMAIPAVANRMGGENSLLSQRTAAQNELNGFKEQRAGLDDGVNRAGPRGTDANDEGISMADEQELDDITEENPAEDASMEEGRVDLTGKTREEVADLAAGADAPQRAAMQKELDGKIEGAQQKLNYFQNQISSNENTGRLASDLFKEASNAVFHGVQAKYVELAAGYRADGLSAQYNQTTDEKAAQTMLRTMAENYSYLSSVLQALGQVASAAA